MMNIIVRLVLFSKHLLIKHLYFMEVSYQGCKHIRLRDISKHLRSAMSILIQQVYALHFQNSFMGLNAVQIIPFW
jgi:hypothetical protein